MSVLLQDRQHLQQRDAARRRRRHAHDVDAIRPADRRRLRAVGTRRGPGSSACRVEVRHACARRSARRSAPSRIVRGPCGRDRAQGLGVGRIAVNLSPACTGVPSGRENRAFASGRPACGKLPPAKRPSRFGTVKPCSAASVAVPKRSLPGQLAEALVREAEHRDGSRCAGRSTAGDGVDERTAACRRHRGTCRAWRPPAPSRDRRTR